MANTQVKANFKDDIFNGPRKYQMINNGDGTYSFMDATQYTQDGDYFGANEANAIGGKLNGIEDGANNYNHPLTHTPAIIQQDANNRFVTDSEKTAWNNKAGTAAATTSVNGLMSAADKIKLDGVATGANNYTHPSTHPATILTDGTLAAGVVATNSTDYTTSRLRNIHANTVDLTAGTSALASGSIYLVYE